MFYTYLFRQILYVFRFKRFGKFIRQNHIVILLIIAWRIELFVVAVIYLLYIQEL